MTEILRTSSRRRRVVALATGLAVLAPLARASDPTGIIVLGYVFFAGVFAVAFAMVWVLTGSAVRWLRVLARVAAVAVFWSPIQLGSVGNWFPVCFIVMEPSRIRNGLWSILATTLFLWVLALLLLPGDSPPPRPSGDVK